MLEVEKFLDGQKYFKTDPNNFQKNNAKIQPLNFEVKVKIKALLNRSTGRKKRPMHGTAIEAPNGRRVL